MDKFKKFFESRDIDVFPSIIQAVGPDNINKLLLQHKDHPKYQIFRIIDDHEFDISSFEGHIILRTSATKSKLKANEYIFPYFYYCQNELQDILPRRNKPIIGFCGENNKHRQKIIKIIQHDKRFDANFILRDKFWAGKPNDPQVIKDFQGNMAASHFNVCNRGAGNFTMRFYQTLSASRIPILLDTDIAFPLEDQINYKEFCIIGKNEEDTIDQVNQVWQDGDIELMQQKAGETFHSKLSMNKYHESLYQSLISNHKI